MDAMRNGDRSFSRDSEGRRVGSPDETTAIKLHEGDTLWSLVGDKYRLWKDAPAHDRATQEVLQKNHLTENSKYYAGKTYVLPARSELDSLNHHSRSESPKPAYPPVENIDPRQVRGQGRVRVDNYDPAQGGMQEQRMRGQQTPIYPGSVDRPHAPYRDRMNSGCFPPRGPQDGGYAPQQSRPLPPGYLPQDNLPPRPPAGIPPQQYYDRLTDINEDRATFPLTVVSGCRIMSHLRTTGHRMFHHNHMPLHKMFRLALQMVARLKLQRKSAISNTNFSIRILGLGRVQIRVMLRRSRQNLTLEPRNRRQRQMRGHRQCCRMPGNQL